MNILIPIFSIIVILSLIIYIITYKLKIKKQNKSLQNLAEKREDLNLEIKQHKKLIDERLIDIAKIETEISAKKEFNTTLQKNREDEIRRSLEKEKEYKTAAIEKEIHEWSKSAQEAANYVQKQLSNELQEEYSKLYLNVEEYRSKQEAINQDIVRQQKLKEETEFYKIQIDDESLEDIEILTSIKNKLYNNKMLDKVIYDNYINKPVLEMTRRVLPRSKVCGIYKITNQLNEMIYIGRSVDIRNRWRGHCRSAFGLEGLADSLFQRALKKDGIQNFTFELLEEVDRENINDREKYWIEFYKSNVYGYNMKVG